MASLFNSKHNKYVSIPDWFKDVQPTVEKPVETKTTYIGSSGGNSTAGLSNIAIYNKFVLEDVELDNEALIFENIVLNTIKTEEHEIGDELQATGWSTTDFISVAGNSKMVVNSKIVTNEKQYGIMFYDNTKTIINHIVLKESTEEVSVPENAYYFRISTPSGYADFKIEYKIAIGYTNEQLELSNNAQSDYLVLNEEIPEGFNKTNITPETISLLVQPPLSLTKDINNIIKLSIKDAASDINDMFVWDKKLAAFGYDKELKQAYSYIDGEQQFTTNDKGEEVPVMTDNPEFWMYDPELTNDWIIKTTRQRFSVLDGLMEYDAKKDSFIFHKNIITSGGVVMYADLGDVKVPDLYDGLVTDATIVRDGEGVFGVPIDNETLVLKDGKIIVSENISGQAEWGKIKYKPAWLEDGQISYDEVVGLTDLLKGFVTTTGEEQDVYGIKNFKNGIKINNLFIKNSQSDVIYIDANLVVRGGVTMYAIDTVTVPSIIDSLPPASYNSKGIASFDSKYFSINNGHVTFIPENVGLNKTELNTILDQKGFATQAQLTTQVNELRQYVATNFVTLKGEDIIEGKKNFIGGLFVNGNQIVYDAEEKYWKLDGNLIVTGGITMYGDTHQGGSSESGVSEAIVRQIVESYNYVTKSDLPSFNTLDFTITNNTVSLNTHIVTSNGNISAYDPNTLYIIL